MWRLSSFLFDFAPSEGSAIEHNDVTMVDSIWGGVSLAGSVSRSLVAHNKLSGRAATALRVFSFGPDLLAEGNVFEANKLKDFQSTTADVYFEENTRDTVVTGKCNSVIDLGVNNSAECKSKKAKGQQNAELLPASTSP